jgi:hypothetical protein
MLSIPARIWLLAFAITSLLVSTSVAQSLADLLTGAELADPAQRANVVARMQAIERTRRDAALKLAGQRGLPLRVLKPNGAVMELADFVDDAPLYFTTHNVNAAISTGANLLQATPFSLTGCGHHSWCLGWRCSPRDASGIRRTRDCAGWRSAG